MYRDQDQRNFARELRNHTTPAEKRLWHYLCAEKLGANFRRQAAIGAYIVDFVCFSHNLIIELDGPQHLDTQQRDAQRAAWLTSRGFKVIRFRNQTLDENIGQVVDALEQALKQCELKLQAPLPQPSPQGGGSRTGLV